MKGNGEQDNSCWSNVPIGNIAARGHFNAVSILQFQDLWMSGSMTISSWFVSVQVVFHEQSFCPKGSVGISSINAGEQAELSWPNYAFNWIANCCPSKKISTGKKQTKNYTRYTLLLEWLPFPFVQMNFICMRMKNHFHIKGWAVNLVVIQRPGRTRKWLIPVKLILCARTEMGNRKIVVGQTSRSGISRREETLML